MMSIRGFLVLSSTCSRLVKPPTNFLKFVNATREVLAFPRIDCDSSVCNQIRYSSTNDADTLTITERAETTSKKERAKTPEAPKITLLDWNNKISVCTMQEAEKIATSKKLKLVRLIDSKLKTQRPTFRLMSEAEYLEEELKEKLKSKEENKQSSFVKGTKLATISTRSTKHDIEVKIKKALKWLEKRFEVRVVISGDADNTAPLEEIYKQFESAFKTVGRIVQKRIKNGILRFQIIPPKREDSAEADDKAHSEEEHVVTEKEEIDHEKLKAVEKSM